MLAKCLTCLEYWQVSWLQKIPNRKYECPACAKERKERVDANYSDTRKS